MSLPRMVSGMRTKAVRIPVERYEHIRKYYLGQNGAFTFAEAFEQYIENMERRIEEAEARARSYKDSYEHLSAALYDEIQDSREHDGARLERLWKGLKSLFG